MGFDFSEAIYTAAGCRLGDFLNRAQEFTGDGVVALAVNFYYARVITHYAF